MRRKRLYIMAVAIRGDPLMLRVFAVKAYRDKFCKKIGSPRDVIVETIDDVFASLLEWQKRQDPRPCDAEG
jgi:hypothetical protein